MECLSCAQQGTVEGVYVSLNRKAQASRGSTSRLTWPWAVDGKIGGSIESRAPHVEAVRERMLDQSAIGQTKRNLGTESAPPANPKIFPDQRLFL
jgi:hypothetical protein